MILYLYQMQSKDITLFNEIQVFVKQNCLFKRKFSVRKYFLNHKSLIINNLKNKPRIDIFLFFQKKLKVG